MLLCSTLYILNINKKAFDNMKGSDIRFIAHYQYVAVHERHSARKHGQGLIFGVLPFFAYIWLKHDCV